jgi:hypothetical protein
MLAGVRSSVWVSTWAGDYDMVALRLCSIGILQAFLHELFFAAPASFFSAACASQLGSAP